MRGGETNARVGSKTMGRRSANEGGIVIVNDATKPMTRAKNDDAPAEFVRWTTVILGCDELQLTQLLNPSCGVGGIATLESLGAS